MNHTLRAILLAAAVLLVPACGDSSSGGGAPPPPPGSSPALGATKTVSLAAFVPGDSDSYSPDVSSDGRFVCFQSYASNLVPNDTNFRSDVFVKDLQTGIIERISVSTNGVQANSDSYDCRISNDGRFVTFASSASNLVPGDNNGRQDIFLRDRLLDTTIRVSTGLFGEGNSDSFAPDISGDGRTVVFVTYSTNFLFFDFNGYPDVFAYDVGGFGLELISVSTGGSQANSWSDFRPSVSADGRRVCFVSSGSNLGPDANFFYDVFLRDRDSQTTSLMSTTAGGTIANSDSYYAAISDDGTKVVFFSYAGNLGGNPFYSNVYVKDTTTLALSVASTDTNGTLAADYVDAMVSISADGTFVSFGAYDFAFSGLVYTGPADTNFSSDLFVKNMVTGELVMASTSSAGAQSPFGIYSYYSSIGSTGQFITFAGPGNGLVAGDTGYPADIHVKDLGTGELTGVTYLPGLTNGHNFKPSVSDDGVHVAFESLASSLVSGDLNGEKDVFVRDTSTDSTVRISVDQFGGDADGPSTSPSISASGRYVAFASEATDLTGLGTAFACIHLRDRDPASNGFDGPDGSTIKVSVDSGGSDPNGPSSNPALSGDGTQVAFESLASDLVPGTTVGRRHIYVRNLTAGANVLISMDAAFAEGDSDSFSPAISTTGRFVTFSSLASNLVAGDGNAAPDVFIVDRDPANDGFDGADRSIIRISVATDGTEANGGSYSPSISGDGDRVAFASDATNLVANDLNGAQDVFVRFRAAATTTRVSLGAAGNEASSACASPAISRDGRMVAFQSIASNLVADESLGLQDVFVRDLSLDTTVRASLSFLDGEADGESYSPALSGDGAYVAFYSTATNIQEGDVNGYADVFLRGSLFGP